MKRNREKRRGGGEGGGGAGWEEWAKTTWRHPLIPGSLPSSSQSDEEIGLVGPSHVMTSPSVGSRQARWKAFHPRTHPWQKKSRVESSRVLSRRRARERALNQSGWVALLIAANQARPCHKSKRPLARSRQDDQPTSRRERLPRHPHTSLKGFSGGANREEPTLTFPHPSSHVEVAFSRSTRRALYAPFALLLLPRFTPRPVARCLRRQLARETLFVWAPKAIHR